MSQRSQFVLHGCPRISGRHSRALLAVYYPGNPGQCLACSADPDSRTARIVSRLQSGQRL